MSLMSNWLSRVPIAAGVKVKVMVQVPPGIRVAPEQLLVGIANSEGFRPINEIVPKIRFVVPLLVMVTVLAGLVVPTVCLT